jgi:phospholipase C
MTPSELQSSIDTIVVVIMENRSFDHVLGHLRHPNYGNRTDVDGIEDLSNVNYLNANSDGIGVAPFWMPDAPLPSDLPHDPGAVQTQMAFASLENSFLMNGFVKAFEDEFHTQIPNPPVIGLLRPEDLPTTSKLAAQYTICDRWFACLPTSTAPNRLMSMCGSSDIADTGTVLPDQTTVYDWLSAHNVRWRVYSAGLPFFALMPRLATLVLGDHFRGFGDLPKDLASDAANVWPQVIFVEPDYYDCPVHFQPPCDNHAPLPMAPGEALLAQVYQWLTSRPDRWSRTLLVVTYDEHGGFFDHVPPRPVKYRNANGVAFDTTGPRVPAMLVGPFAPAGVCNAQLDNTSLLQLFAERFGKPGEAYSADVAGRMQQGVASVSVALSAAAANAAVCGLARVPGGTTAAPPAENTVLRQAFDGAARSLVANHPEEALAKYPRLAVYTTG